MNALSTLDAPVSTSVTAVPTPPPAATRRAEPVLFMAVASDCGATLRAAVERTRATLSSFDRVRWLVVECGSTDDTVAQLEALRRELPGFEFESLGRIGRALPRSSQRRAVGRARCLEHLATDPRYADVSYLIEVDLEAPLGRVPSLRLGDA